jgi:hypothetical protein
MACSSSSPTFIPLALPPGSSIWRFQTGSIPRLVQSDPGRTPGRSPGRGGPGFGMRRRPSGHCGGSRGASRVVATDTDERALDAAARNARAAVWKTASFSVKAPGMKPSRLPSAFFRSLSCDRRHTSQTPGPFPFGPRYGGRDGTDHLCAVIDGAASVLVPATGGCGSWPSLWPIGKVLGHLSALFSTVRVVSETERFFLADE